MAIDMPERQDRPELPAPETAWHVGAADGVNPSFRHTFIQQPDYMPPFLLDVVGRFKKREHTLLNERNRRLDVVAQDAVTSARRLRTSVTKLFALSDRLETYRLELEAGSSADSDRSWQGVSLFSGEEAELRHRERETKAQFDRYNEEVEQDARSLDTMESRYLGVWNHYLSEAKGLLQDANVLIDNYTSGLLSTHDLGGAVARCWKPPRPRLEDDWFEDPQPRMREALPTSGRDNSEQSFLQWLDLLRRDLLPRSIERGDSHDFGR